MSDPVNPEFKDCFFSPKDIMPVEIGWLFTPLAGGWTLMVSSQEKAVINVTESGLFSVRPLYEDPQYEAKVSLGTKHYSTLDKAKSEAIRGYIQFLEFSSIKLVSLVKQLEREITV